MTRVKGGQRKREGWEGKREGTDGRGGWRGSGERTDGRLGKEECGRKRKDVEEDRGDIEKMKNDNFCNCASECPFSPFLFCNFQLPHSEPSLHSLGSCWEMNEGSRGAPQRGNDAPFHFSRLDRSVGERVPSHVFRSDLRPVTFSPSLEPYPRSNQPTQQLTSDLRFLSLWKRLGCPRHLPSGLWHHCPIVLRPSYVEREPLSRLAIGPAFLSLARTILADLIAFSTSQAHACQSRLAPKKISLFLPLRRFRFRAS